MSYYWWNLHTSPGNALNTGSILTTQPVWQLMSGTLPVPSASIVSFINSGWNSASLARDSFTDTDFVYVVSHSADLGFGGWVAGTGTNTLYIHSNALKMATGSTAAPGLLSFNNIANDDIEVVLDTVTRNNGITFSDSSIGIFFRAHPSGSDYILCRWRAASGLGHNSNTLQYEILTVISSSLVSHYSSSIKTWNNGTSKNFGATLQGNFITIFTELAGGGSRTIELSASLASTPLVDDNHKKVGMGFRVDGFAFHTINSINVLNDFNGAPLIKLYDYNLQSFTPANNGAVLREWRSGFPGTPTDLIADGDGFTSSSLKCSDFSNALFTPSFSIGVNKVGLNYGLQPITPVFLGSVTSSDSMAGPFVVFTGNAGNLAITMASMSFNYGIVAETETYAYDAFTDTNGTNVTSHTASIGLGVWRQPNGSGPGTDAQIFSNKAVGTSNAGSDGRFIGTNEIIGDRFSIYGDFRRGSEGGGDGYAGLIFWISGAAHTITAAFHNSEFRYTHVSPTKVNLSFLRVGGDNQSFTVSSSFTWNTGSLKRMGVDVLYPNMTFWIEETGSRITLGTFTSSFDPRYTHRRVGFNFNNSSADGAVSKQLDDFTVKAYTTSGSAIRTGGIINAATGSPHLSMEPVATDPNLILPGDMWVRASGSNGNFYIADKSILDNSVYISRIVSTRVSESLNSTIARFITAEAPVSSTLALNSFVANNWFVTVNTTGSTGTGWRNETWDGGIYMVDASAVVIYGTSKNLLIPSGNLLFRSSAGSIRFSGSLGGNGEGILYTDNTGANRYGLHFSGSNSVILSNRASNGVVQIRANTSTAGAGGEITVADFEDDVIRFYVKTAVTGTLVTTGGITSSISGSGAGLSNIFARTSSIFITEVVSGSSIATGSMSLGKGFMIYVVSSSIDSRFRLYTTESHMRSDISRSVGISPTGSHGVILDLILTGSPNYVYHIAPCVYGADLSPTQTGNIFFASTNMTPLSGAVSYSITRVVMER